MKKILKTSEIETSVTRYENGVVYLCMYNKHDPEMIMEAFFSKSEFNALTKIFNKINKEETK